MSKHGRALLVIGGVILFYIALNTFWLAGEYYASNNVAGSLIVFVTAFSMIVASTWAFTEAKDYHADEE